MSTKTVTKRLALATVVALGAGVLSLVSTTSANAATFNYDTTANATPAYGNMNVATQSPVLVYPAPETSAGGDGRSIGLLSWGDIAGGNAAGTTQTATILSTGIIVVYTTMTITNSVIFKTTNGVINKDGTCTTNCTVNGSLTQLARTAGSTTSGVISVAVKPASGATAFTVAMYTDSAADTAANLLAGSNTGTLTLAGYITVTVATTSLAGAVSASNSGVWYTGLRSPGSTLLTTALTSDSSTLATPGSVGNGSVGYADVRVRDAYGSAVTGAGLLQATATNGALVGFSGSAGSTTAPTSLPSSTAFVAVGAAASADDYTIGVAQPASAPISTVVTFTWNGTVIGTKSFTFSGQIAKINLSSAVNGKTSNSTGNTVVVSFADAVGNTVYPTAAYFTADAASYGGIVSGTSLSTVPSSTAVGKVTYTCGTVAGSTNLDVKYTNTDGTVITSNAIKVTCSGAAVSYTAAYDKTSYKPGDIATLIVTFKDSKGNLANDIDSITATGSLATVSTAGLTAITSPDRLDAASNGVIKYTYSVGSATGAFTNPVTFAYVDGVAKGLGLTASGPVAVTLTIADGSTSLNDVLKGIVSLIASINKQIAALAKLVTKK
jgi:trimeric autotransporter adhesin